MERDPRAEMYVDRDLYHWDRTAGDIVVISKVGWLRYRVHRIRHWLANKIRP